MSKKTALVLVTYMSEEIEVVVPSDILRRAGIEVTLAGVQGSDIHECSRQVKIQPDVSLEEVVGKISYDAVVLPGGRYGSQYLCQSDLVGQLLQDQEKAGGVVAAICAAPTAFKKFGVFQGKRLTTFPTSEEKMVEGGAYIYLQDDVVVDGNLITGRGPGNAFDFALAIVEKLVGKEKAEEVAKGMLFQYQ